MPCPKSDNINMRSFYLANRKKILFVLFSIFFYFIIDLTNGTLRIHSPENGVILFGLSYLFMFTSFIILCRMTKLKRPLVLYGVLFYVGLSSIYATFADRAKAAIYLYTNQSDIDLLTKYVSEVRREDGFLRDQSTDPFYTIYYWDVFFSKQKATLGNAMDKLGIYRIKKYPDHVEYEIAAYSGRYRSLSLIRYATTEDHPTPSSRYAEAKYYDLNAFWGCQRCKFVSLDSSSCYWWGNAKDRKKDELAATQSP
jgi:hypothetical protein